MITEPVDEPFCARPALDRDSCPRSFASGSKDQNALYSYRFRSNLLHQMSFYPDLSNKIYSIYLYSGNFS